MRKLHCHLCDERLAVICDGLLGLFLSPSILSEQLDAHIHLPDAWSMDSFQLGQGFVSDVDLFRHELPIRSLAAAAAAAAAAANKPRPGKGRLVGRVSKPNKIISESSHTDLNKHFLTAYQQSSSTTSSRSSSEAALAAAVLRRYADMPLFRSGEVSIDSSGPKLCNGAYAAIQEEGETVFIPPNSWHQVYHLQPSIAIASQHMNHFNQRQVLQHMLSTCCPAAEVPVLLEGVLGLKEERARVERAIKLALRGRYGLELGAEKMKILYE
jgi:hypothetical protein